MKEVYVVYALPNEPHLSSYIYGVFDTEDQAEDHFNRNGPRDCDVGIRKAQYIPKVN